MVQEDADFVGRLTVQAFEGKFKHCVGSANLERAMRGAADAMRLMEREYHRILVAVYNGQPAGVMELKFHDSRDPSSAGSAFTNYLSCWPSMRLSYMGCVMEHKSRRGECYIAMICCDAAFRGKGIGKQLMQAAEGLARDRHCTHMTLEVAADNRARNLYERQGFVVQHTTDSCVAYHACGVSKFYRMEKRL